MTIHRDYPELAEFFGAYFNQDFSVEYGSFDAAITDFLTNLGENTWVQDALRELGELIAEGRSEESLHAYVVDGAMAIEPNTTVTLFLEMVRDRLSEGIAQASAL